MGVRFVSCGPQDGSGTDSRLGQGCGALSGALCDRGGETAEHGVLQAIALGSS